MIEGLQHILSKRIVVPTVNADDLTNTPAQVDADYTAHAYTFVPMGPVDEIADRLVRQVTSRKTIKGMLIAPYGYGKTSTLVFLWYRCQQQGLLAVPPFYCASLLDILRATYAWARYQFTQRAPGFLNALSSLYQRHYGSTVEERARAYASQFGVTEQAALGILRQQQASGEYRIQLTARALQAFLQELTTLAGEAGFRGLIMFPDEFQAFLGRTDSVRQTLQSLREFVWALNSSKAADGGKVPLGVLISADDTTESKIQTGGGDILDRLREDGFYLNLRTIYDQTFPAALWSRYVETFNLTDDAASLIDTYTLRSIGQIAEREDLARGPRTVIDAFKGAIRHYERTGQSYTPMDLIDDFLEDRIRFEGEGNRLKQATKQALAVSNVTTSERQQAVKLMAAFPRGVNEAVHKHYGLTRALNDLSKGGGHGELMTLLIDGYTLLGLQRTGDGGRHVVDRIMAQFGRDYEADDAHAEAAMRAFEQHILNRIFAARRGAQVIGWDTLDMADSAHGSRYGEVKGTFSLHYPQRVVAVQLAYMPKQLMPEHKAHDLQFDFLLQWQDTPDGTGSGRIERVGQHTLRWHLALKRPLEGDIPGDIKKLQQFVNPAFISPLLLLSLITFIGEWEQDFNESIPERDQPEIKLLTDRLANHALTMLFNQGLHASWEGNLKRAGQGLVEEVFTAWMRERYPHYVTFFNHAQYQEVLRKYQDAVKTLPKKEARGHAAVEKEKNEWARLFEVGSVATFENLLDTAYKPILQKEEWSGSKAKLRCSLHPLEQQIMNQLNTEGQPHYIGGTAVQAVPANALAEHAAKDGYRLEEVLQAIQLLLARKMVDLQRGEQTFIYLPIDTLSVEKLQADLAEQQHRLHELPHGLLSPTQRDSLDTQAAELAARLEGQTDEEELDEINYLIGRLRERITDAITEQQSSLEAQLRTRRNDVDDRLAGLKRIGDQIEPAIQGQVGFVQHISTLRLELMRQHNSLRRDLESQRVTLTTALEPTNGDPVAGVLKLQQHATKAASQITTLNQQFEMLKTRADGLSRWRDVLKQADTLFGAPGLPSDLRDQLTKVIVPSISEFLTKHSFDGLKDWEIFQQKLEALNRQFSERQTAGNQQFGQVKDEYTRVLREINVKQPAMRARYEYGADDESYNDLFQEVKEKINTRLDEIQSELDRVSNDLVRVEHLQALNGDQRVALQSLRKSYQDVLRDLQQVRAKLSIETVRQRETALQGFREQVRGLDDSLGTLRDSISKLLRVDSSRTPDEEKVMELLDGRQDYDLAQLFLSMRRTQDIQLDELLNRLRDLFKKGQVELKVRRRSS